MRLKQIFRKDKLNGRRVDFVVGGTQKGGTTALYTYLKSHPEICMANRREVHFFDREENFSGSRPDYLFYHSNFDVKESNQVIGETTPIYMYWEPAARRIWEYNKAMKFIVVLRNPIERAFSHWNAQTFKNKETASFMEAIVNEVERSREALPLQHRKYSYVDRGFYCSQLRRLRRFFPEDQLLILKSDELKKDGEKELKRISDFLGISDFSDFESLNVNAKPYGRTIDSEERRYLERVYEYEIKQLERDLSWDCSNWLDR